MADEIRRLTDLLARDPGNIAFRDLAERLRVRGDLDSAHRVAVRGLERHTLDAEAHALLARICVDKGELQRAFDEWDMALRLSPRHVGALKGLGFISYRWGRLDDAERYLVDAITIAPDDTSVKSALESVRRARESISGLTLRGAEQLAPPPASASASTPAATTPRHPTPARSRGAAGAPVSPATPKSGIPVSAENGGNVQGVRGMPEKTVQESAASPAASVARAAAQGSASQSLRGVHPRELFEGIDGGPQLQAVLVDRDGLVVAGRFVRGDGADRTQEIGAELSGVSDEAGRAVRHLRMGEWKSITFESKAAAVAMTRAGGDSLVVVAAEQGMPLGLLRRALDWARRRASAWMEGA